MIKFRWYQKLMLAYGLVRAHVIYFVDMRLGKTIPVIRLCKHWKNTKHVLIVAPYAAFMGWRDDLKKEKQLPAIELSETIQQRKEDLFNNWGTHKYFMLSKEGYLYLPEIAEMDWDVVILDESTFIKNVKPQVTKFYCNNFRQVSHRVIMTGLPDPEGELDYYHQLKFVDPQIIPMEYWAFRTKYFDESGYDIFINKKGRRYLSQRLAKHCFFLTRKEAGIGSEKIYETRLIQCPAKIRKVYNLLKEEYIFEMGDRFMATKYATVKFNWMRKVLGGVFDGESIWNGKCDEIKSLINGELKGQPLIIWCQYIDEILHVERYFNVYFKKKYKKSIYKRKKIDVIYGKISQVKREQIIIKFQRGKLDWLIVQPRTARYAIDFSRALTFIYYSIPGRETRSQTEDRGISAFVKEDKLMVDLIVEKTIEEDLYESFKLKESKTKRMRRIIHSLQKEVI